MQNTEHMHGIRKGRRQGAECHPRVGAEAAQARQLKMSRGRWLSCELTMLAADEDGPLFCRGSIMSDWRSVGAGNGESGERVSGGRGQV